MLKSRITQWSTTLGFRVLIACVTYLGIILAFPPRGADSYRAGDGDHFVLSPQGLAWADPQAFRKDWFLEYSPQPHWFFDVVTFVGESLGSVSLAYALWFLAQAFTIGLAMALLADHLFPGSPRRSLGFACLTTLLLIAAPVLVVGTINLSYAVSLPTLLGAQLGFLFIVLLISGREKWAWALLPLICVIHVQVGAMTLVIALLALAYLSWSRKKIQWRGVLGLALGGAAVVIAMKLRSVAGHPSDFVEICDIIIPYHCSAYMWTTEVKITSFALILLSILAAVFLRGSRPIWALTLGVMATALLAGFVIDIVRIPVLAQMMQAFNGYRLAILLPPFAAAWLAYVVIHLFSRSLPLYLKAVTVVLGSLWIGGFPVRTALLSVPFGKSITGEQGLALNAVSLLVIFVLMGAAFRWHRKLWTVVSVAALCIGICAGLVLAGSQPNPSVYGWEGRRLDGALVFAGAIPAGETLLVSPRYGAQVRLQTRRAVFVDCKNVPYGGEGYRMWKERFAALGVTFGQDGIGKAGCYNAAHKIFTRLSAEDLIRIADDYKINYIIPASRRQSSKLKELGWVSLKKEKLDSYVGQLEVMRRPGK